MDNVVDDLFAVIERSPTSIAILQAERAVTYKEFGDLVASVRDSVASQTEPGDVVAVSGQRSAESIACMVGVMGAGRVYLPIDPASPADRQRQLLSLGKAKLILADQDVSPDSSVPSVPFSAATRHGGASDPRTHPSPPVDDAYMLFTSGSTGTPKGVRGTHRGLLNLSSALRALYQFGPADRHLQFSAFSWDTSLEETLPILHSGAVLVLRPSGLASLQGFLDYCSDAGITSFNLPTAFWAELVREECLWPTSARLVVIGGEAVPREAVEMWLDRHDNQIRLVNTYGLTEATAVTTACDLNRELLDPDEDFAPIGYPISGVGVYVRPIAGADPSAAATEGELVVQGVSVASGYVNPSPADASAFGNEAAVRERTFGTGDVVRQDPGGLLHYKGRRDSQVKIRGFRIELGEVEAALRRIDGVGEAVALKTVSEFRSGLTAFVTPARQGVQLDSSAVRVSIADRLPAHMIPGRLEVLDSMPRLASGKPDRDALAGMDRSLRRSALAPGEEGSLLIDTVARVLNLDVGSADGFLALGGDSITALVVSTKLSRLGYALQPGDLLAAETLSDVPVVRRPDFGREGADVEPVRAGDRLPLTPMQQGVLFETLNSSDTQVYLDQDVWRIDGSLELPIFEGAWRDILDRHAPLRTAFFWPDGEVPYRSVLEDVSPVFERLDWTHLSSQEQEGRLQELLQAGLRVPVPLQEPPLMRFVLVRLEDTKHYLVWYAHRLILDGWSTTAVLDELVELYAAAVEGRQPRLPAVVDYERYVTLTREPSTQTADDFWRDYLKELTPTPLPGSDRVRSRYERSGQEHAKVVVRLQAGLVGRLEDQLRAQRVTLSSFFRAAWAVMLSRYAGRSDIVFGATCSGRPSLVPEVSTGVGLFINTLPVRVQVHEDMTVADLLEQVQQDAFAMSPFELTSLQHLQEVVDLADAAIFETLVIVQNYPGAASYSREGALSLEHVHAFEQVQYTLSLTLRYQSEDDLRCEIWYEPSIVDPTIAESLAEGLETLVVAMVEAPTSVLVNLPTIGERQRRTLTAWGRGAEMDNTAHTLDLIRRHVAAADCAVALAGPVERITYQELWSAAQTIARHLEEQGVGRGDVVAICAPRSGPCVSAMLAAWMVGGSYVGIDPALPSARKSLIVEMSEAKVLLFQRPDGVETGTIPKFDLEVLVTERNTPRELTEAELFDGSLPAYIVFTSGTTGQPKGVVIAHSALSNYVLHSIAKYDLSEQDRGLVGAPISVDWFVSELFPILASGGTAYLRPDDLYEDTTRLLDFCAQNDITVLMPPTSLWHQLVRDGVSTERSAPSLRIMDIGGERAIPQMLQTWLEIHGDRGPLLLNGFGPSEITVECTSGRLSGPNRDALLPGHEVPIGRPIPNTGCHVLDSHGRLSPVGSAGELHVCGAGVALGYLNDPELTGARFVSDTICSTNGKMYRTGDLVRWLPTGSLEYLGRLDRQAKIGGNRFEPQEIEAALLQREEVGEALVVARVGIDGEASGVDALIVPSRGNEVNIDELLVHVKASLPSILIPGTIAVAEELPRTLQGKLDSGAAKEMIARAKADLKVDDGSAPITAGGAVLLTEFETILGEFDPGASFFGAGGNSLVAMRLIGHLRKRHDVHLSFDELARVKNLGRFADLLASRSSTSPGSR